MRKIYKKIKIEYPRLENSVCLSLAVHAVNNTGEPDGLIPTLLVFAMIPQIPLGNIDHLPQNQRDRFAAMASARKKMETIIAAQRFKLAQKSRSKPVDVFSIPPGADVLVYRDKSNLWEEPFTLHSYDNYKTAYVKIKDSVKLFSITSVKQFLTEPAESEPEENATPLSTVDRPEILHDPVFAPKAQLPTIEETLDNIRLGIGRENELDT